MAQQRGDGLKVPVMASHSMVHKQQLQNLVAQQQQQRLDAVLNQRQLAQPVTAQPNAGALDSHAPSANIPVVPQISEAHAQQVAAATSSGSGAASSGGSWKARAMAAKRRRQEQLLGTLQPAVAVRPSSTAVEGALLAGTTRTESRPPTMPLDPVHPPKGGTGEPSLVDSDQARLAKEIDDSCSDEQRPKVPLAMCTAADMVASSAVTAAQRLSEVTERGRLLNRTKEREKLAFNLSWSGKRF